MVEEYAEHDTSVKEGGKMTPLATCFHAGFMLVLFFDLENVSPKRRLTFNGLHGVISQKT
jgi:hypothetical protein